MRLFRLASGAALLSVAATMCGGCFAFSTVLTVRGDGSGTIRQRVLFPPTALAQIRGLGGLRDVGGLGGRGGAASPVFDPLPEPQARARATAFGEGVTYVSSAAIDTSEGRGTDITYAFADITKIHIDEHPPALEGVTLDVTRRALDVMNPHVTFALARAPGGNVLLRVNAPLPDISGLGIPQGGGTHIPADQMAMFRQMFAGAHLSIAVEPDGELVRTSSSYVDGDRVTLIDVDVDDILMDDDALLRLRAARTPDEVNAALRDFAAGAGAGTGVKVSVDRDVTIEFSPAR
jgi:hypothetical protein